LHSHQLTWGSGSRQQSITAVQNQDDPNSLWIIKEAHRESPCETGTPVLCNQIIRLEHVNTKKNLHSHEYASFITDSQEVRKNNFMKKFSLPRQVDLGLMGKEI